MAGSRKESRLIARRTGVLTITLTSAFIVVLALVVDPAHSAEKLDKFRVAYPAIAPGSTPS
jgi:hypothetical protein